MQYFPDVSIKSGFELTNASRLPLVKSITTSDAKLSLDLAELLFGRIRVDALRLIRPEITLKEAPSLVMGPDQTPAGASGQPAQRRAGRRAFACATARSTCRRPTGTEAIKKIDARFDASSGTGAMSSFGSFQLRMKTVRFAFESGAPSDTANGLRMPVSLTLTSTPMTAKVTGTASFANGLQLDGDVQADMTNARRLSPMGRHPVAGRAKACKSCRHRASAHWNGSTLTFDDGSFTLDGNTAVGLLAVTPGPRPRVDGTLAFDRLALDPYLGSGAPAERAEAAKHGITGRSASAQIFRCRSAHLGGGDHRPRKSRSGAAGSPSAPSKAWSRARWASLSCAAARRRAASASICRKRLPKPLFTATVSDVPVEDCLKQLALDVPVNGTGGLKAELSAEGRNYDELIQGSRGASS